MRQFFTIIFTLSFMFALADMTAYDPSTTISIKLQIDNNKTPEFDSICVIGIAHRGGIDTFIVNYSDIDFRRHDLHPLKKLSDCYEFNIIRHVTASFRIIVFKNGKECKSDLISYYPGYSFYKFDISKGFRDVSPLFHTEWYKYFLSLLITLLIEFLIGLPFYFKYKNSSTTWRYFGVTFILINVLTHFSLWYIDSHLHLNLLLLEAGVLLIETIYWRQLLKTSIGNSLLISFLTNLGSFIIGGLVAYSIW